MKAFILAASVAAAAAAVPALASAQDGSGMQAYGSLGYADTNASHLNLGTVQGRLGARFGQHLGVEGEVGLGVAGDNTTVSGVNVKASIRNQEAIYGVGFLPLSPNFDLLARVGYGDTRVKAKASGVSLTDSGGSWNYGVGGQYRFDDKNGVRADYTREEFTGGGNGGANVYALSYVRTF